MKQVNNLNIIFQQQTKLYNLEVNLKMFPYICFWVLIITVKINSNLL